MNSDPVDLQHFLGMRKSPMSPRASYRFLSMNSAVQTRVFPVKKKWSSHNEEPFQFSSVKIGIVEITVLRQEE